MIEEYPDTDQRLAVAIATWDNRKAKGGDNMNREHKSFDVEFKATEEGVIEGYAAFFNNVDSYGDIILPGAFEESIKKAKKNKYKDVKIFWNHNWNGVPIGKPVEMFEDDQGLYIKGQLNKTSMAQDVKEALKDGSVSKMSIGFITVDSQMKTIEGESRRLLKKLDLFEFSPVNFPANELADITSYKKMLDDSEEELSKIVEKLFQENIEKLKQILKEETEEEKECDTEKVKSMLNEMLIKNKLKTMLN